MAVIPDDQSAGEITPTPTLNKTLPFKVGGVDSVVEALEYAARGETGYNFFNLRGEVWATVPYSALAQKAKDLAGVLAHRFERRSRIAIVAETSPEFIITFYTCPISYTHLTLPTKA